MSSIEHTPLNIGLVGGGAGFITQAHQRAIFMDGTRRVVAGALSSNPDRSLEAAANWPYPMRGYRSFEEMAESESALPEGERIDYVVVMTPNHAHYEPAQVFIEAGIPVFCEKPLTLSVVDSDRLRSLVNEKRIPFCVAHTYLGHWTSRLARQIVRSGKLGRIRWVDVSYLQAGKAIRSRRPDFNTAAWRFDPSRSGPSNCGGDIGTHALMQFRYVTGLEVTDLSAHLETFIPTGKSESSELDDHFTAYCRLSNGGRGLLRASQIAIGHKNDLQIEVVGELGALRWRQEEAEKLVICLADQMERVYWRGGLYAGDDFLRGLPEELWEESTLPWGHVEGLHDALARLHRSFELDVRRYQSGDYEGSDGSKYATVEDGVMGLRFVEKAVESSRKGNAWVSFGNR